MLKEQKDELIKGFYSLFSDYKDNTLNKHSKKGSEIKEGLSTISSELTKKKADCLGKMTAELSKVSIAPDEKADYDKEYHHLLDYIPGKFSYDLIYHGEKYTKTDNGISEQAVKVPTDEEKVEMREYNGYARKYMEHCIDKIKIESLKRNIQDNKSYSLSTNQLAILGL